jgi:hypothetical protein
MVDEKTPPRLTIRDYKAPAREVTDIPWPGNASKRVGLLCPLTVAELQLAHFEAIEYFARKVQPNDGMSMRDFLLEEDVQECFLFLLQPGTKRPKDRLFKDADEARSSLDPDELRYFQDAYAHLCEVRLRAMGLWDETSRATTKRPWVE